MPRLLPGLALTAGATVVLLGLAPLLTRTVPAASPLVLALLTGAVAGSVLGARGRRSPGRRGARFAGAARPGADWVARHVLRAGVVLLGLQLSLGDVVALGWRGLTVVTLTVAVTFGATLALGPRLGVPRDTTLLVATGFSICGAAAVSAMTGVLDRLPDRRDDDTPRDAAAVALALVALYGTAAVVVLPRLAGLLGLTGTQAGLWIGASVQEVAQVVAGAGGLAGTTALTTATVAKLARVVLLAPLVAATGAVRARRVALAAPHRTGAHDGGTRVALVPGFVLGFLGAAALRSLGVVPGTVLDAAGQVTTALFVAAMFALGLGVDVPRLVRTGGRALLLGACSAVVVTGTALGAVLLLVP
ncbi:putative integral membrane protein (TIGR00698 family) [Isoptericola sp. CG 20/1183]|uniref:Integral membrane protein (TIGR00698 family) n=1 Tax=Isoptericola halotolerans TaxID=300560 RepID=A0ABX5EC91_9MICO|nr:MULTISPECIES: putative sulfate exporter family transporter [Isoptericola]PRZ05203.1 putative integral membrane protein (TIGR00698 family) [Isoptericola halotolerans]PRZ05941.1 putative integral membrane protein (TIGR00698 family) [Isoptericola sp. CG 20/1183]